MSVPRVLSAAPTVEPFHYLYFHRDPMTWTSHRSRPTTDVFTYVYMFRWPDMCLIVMWNTSIWSYFVFFFFSIFLSCCTTLVVLTLGLKRDLVRCERSPGQIFFFYLFLFTGIVKKGPGQWVIDSPKLVRPSRETRWTEGRWFTPISIVDVLCRTCRPECLSYLDYKYRVFSHLRPVNRKRQWWYEVNGTGTNDVS